MRNVETNLMEQIKTYFVLSNREERDGWVTWRKWGREEACYRVLVGKPEGKRPLGRPRIRWVENIKMDFQEVGCVNMDWIELAQDRVSWLALVNAVTNLRVP
jgi:hypothetical protein